MALETGNYISNLVATNPPGTDPKSQGDDHLRLIKNAVKNSLPGFTGTVIATGTDTGAANAYVLTPSPALLAYSTNMVVEFIPVNSSTGASTINISGLGAVTIQTVAGAAIGLNDIQAGYPVVAIYNGSVFKLVAITKNYADQLAFGTSLPNQTGNADKMITTNGTVASWTDLIKVGTMKLADSTDTTKRAQFVLSGISTATTRTLTARDRNAVIGPDMQLDTRSSGTNTQLTVADIGKLVDITTGTFTQTFDACASLQSGWWIRIRNSGTGNITLDPNASEQIDGLTSYIMYPGECRDIQCDGTKLTTVIVKPYRVRFTSSGTWTKPPGYSEHGGEVGSGGASGSKSAAATIVQGGPGGGVFPFQFPDSQLGATESITVGAGGAVQTVASTDGNAGGNSSFGSWITVMGGVVAPGSGGPVGGSVIVSGTLGITNAAASVAYEATVATGTGHGIWAGAKGDNSAAAVSGNSIFGGGAGGSVNAAGTLRAPGTSKRGGNGGAASVAGNGTAGTFPCGGGGGTQTGSQSGAGANGYVDVWGMV